MVDASVSAGGESKGNIETKELSSPTTRVGRVMSVAKAGSKMGLRPTVVSMREEMGDAGGTMGNVRDCSG